MTSLKTPVLVNQIDDNDFFLGLTKPPKGNACGYANAAIKAPGLAHHAVLVLFPPFFQ